MPQQEETNTYFLIDNEPFVEAPGFLRGFVSTDSLGFMLARDETPTRQPIIFRFGRMFRQPELSAFRPAIEGLIELGLDMRERTDPGHNPGLPAGYVYLGQFIDHDLSFNAKTNNLPTGTTRPETEESLRSPSVDLDSLYGSDPALLKQSYLGKKIYEADGVRLIVGETRKDDDAGVLRQFPNDLPREGDPRKPEAAAIVDPRNDENLAVAQTHLAFIKFHNVVVDRLSGGMLAGDALFDAARESVVRHYQWIILKDYLPKVVETEVLDDVVENGCRHFVLADDEQPFVPFEFAMAAFRFGHGLVRSEYEWNRVFQSRPHGISIAALSHLFTFTGFGQQVLFNRKRLLSSWIIDWTRFYDFTGFPGVTNSTRSNLARRIVPSLSAGLTRLPPFMSNEAKLLSSLPTRNLLRGHMLGLPSGQDVAARLGVRALEPGELKEQEDTQRGEILERFELDRQTPLWYYVLKEAERFHGGERLGPVGSRILAETLVGLIRRSRTSILPSGPTGGPIWGPDQGRNPGQFSIAELLFQVHQATGDHLNPLGN